MLDSALVVGIEAHWIVSVVEYFGWVQFLAFDLGHVLRNLESPLVEDRIGGDSIEKL